MDDQNRFCFFLIAAILVVGLRGGFQSKPLRPSFAFRNTNAALAHLSLNPVFTVFYALKTGDVAVPRFMPDEQAVAITRRLYRTEGWEYASPVHPLLKTPVASAGSPQARPNIVVMILESWAAEYVGALGGMKGITPNFDRLASQGLLFTNFFATGHRSTDGITAVCCSVPTFEDMQIINSALEQNRFLCLGSILGEAGYSSLFLHGAKTGSFGLNGFSRVAGFKRYIGKEDFDLGENDADPTWGVFDHVALKRLNRELASMRPPFLGLWFSLSSHSPYHLPAEKYKVTPHSVPDYELIDTLAYSDESLGEFFRLAATEDYFKNTIFVLLADHTAGSTINGTWERYRIPCLIYAPGRIPAGVVDSVASQLDLLPTILELAHVRSPHHSVGRSLISPDHDGLAFVDLGGQWGWFHGDRLLLANAESPAGLFDWRKDPEEKENLLSKDAAKTRELATEVQAFVQTTKSLIRQNRLALERF